MEKKVKMQKDNIKKQIPVNLVSEYQQLGWEKVKTTKETSKGNQFSSFSK